LERAARYATGDGVQKNEQKAAKIYATAVRNGSGIAAFNLAAMYARGEGVKRSWAKAETLYRRAERLGSGDASITLGELDLRRNKSDSGAEIEALRHFAMAAVNHDVRGLLRMASTIQSSTVINKQTIVEAMLFACAQKGSKEARSLLKRATKS
jgi:TPR repeat protein